MPICLLVINSSCWATFTHLVILLMSFRAMLNASMTSHIIHDIYDIYIVLCMLMPPCTSWHLHHITPARVATWCQCHVAIMPCYTRCLHVTCASAHTTIYALINGQPIHRIQLNETSRHIQLHFVKIKRRLTAEEFCSTPPSQEA